MINREELLNKIHSMEASELVGLIRKALSDSDIKYVESGSIVFDSILPIEDNAIQTALLEKNDSPSVCYTPSPPSISDTWKKIVTNYSEISSITVHTIMLDAA